jgi:serine protease Do
MIGRGAARAGILTGSVLLLALAGCTGSATTAGDAGTSLTDPADTHGRPGISEDLRIQIAKARDSVFPALVHINVVTVTHFGGKETKMRSAGSGTLISPDGYVLTNAHVTNEGVTFFCTLADKRRVPARLVGEDPFTDLAVLHINPDDLKASGKAVEVATFGDSAQLRLGDFVMAMGSPFALSRSVTLGVVSNTERVFTQGLGDGDMDELTIDGLQRTGIFTNWIQHDASINPGNSGGPLVDLGGHVIGVNTRGGNGLSFATPANLARAVAQSLIERGEVARSWIGVSLRPIEDTGFTRGVLVDSVETDGPAAAAGIKPGDLITAVEGEPVTVRFVEEVPPLLQRIATRSVGATMQFAYERDGVAQTAEVSTKKLLKDKGNEVALREWGTTIQPITPRIARFLRIDSTEGALVNSVRGGSTAALAEPSLNSGDIVRSIDGQPVKSTSDLVAYYEKVVGMEKPPEYVVVEYDRQGKNFLTLVKTKADKPQDPSREVPKAWLGVATQPVLQRLAERLGGTNEAGFRVTRVYPKTTAADAGIKVGDVVTAINGKKVKPRGLQDTGLFTRSVKELEVGKPAELTIVRDNAPVTLSVNTERERIGAAEAFRDSNKNFDLVVRELTFFDRDDNRWDDSVTGVLVENVENAGWAGLGGVREGDLIQRIDSTPITSLADYRKAMEAIEKARPKRVVFFVLRGVSTSFRFVEPEWGPGPKDGSGVPAASTPAPGNAGSK